MGCGKTAIGRALSARLEVPFLDSDAEIEAAAQSTIAESFERDGEAFFREREAEVLERLMAAPPGVLSTGGGAFLRKRNQDTIRRGGIALWLDAPLDLLWDRVRHKDTRPLLRTANPKETLARLFAERTPEYAKAALRIDVQPGASIEQTTQTVLDCLARVPEVLEP